MREYGLVNPPKKRVLRNPRLMIEDIPEQMGQDGDLADDENDNASREEQGIRQEILQHSGEEYVVIDQLMIWDDHRDEIDHQGSVDDSSSAHGFELHHDGSPS